MTQILGVNLPRNKKILYSLPQLFGINLATSKKICAEVGITEHCKVYHLNEFQVSRISKTLENQFMLETDLRKDIENNIRRFINIKCYKGYRHTQGLPVHGQRTHTNAQTQKKLGARRKIKK